jgi:Fe-S cluster assembly ATP-binding protein
VLLKVEGLTVKVGGREVVKDANLEVDREEVHALMGPNACGKTSLAMAIMGHPLYEVTRGRILFEGKDITSMEMFERVRLGLAMTYQHPPEIVGVKLGDLIRALLGEEPWDPAIEPREELASKYLMRVGLCPALFLRRDVNVGFSGGERKRSELAQLLAMRPRLMILDEVDSGVDIDSLKLIGAELDKAIEELGASALVITHYRHILNYLRPDVIHVMYDGRIIFSGDPEPTLKLIERRGYEGFVKEVL